MSLRETFLVGWRVVLGEQDKILSSILPTRVANHIGVFDSSRPLIDPKPYKTYIM